MVEFSIFCVSQAGCGANARGAMVLTMEFERPEESLLQMLVRHGDERLAQQLRVSRAVLLALRSQTRVGEAIVSGSLRRYAERTERATRAQRLLYREIRALELLAERIGREAAIRG